VTAGPETGRVWIDERKGSGDGGLRRRMSLRSFRDFDGPSPLDHDH